jgi:serine/threonine-protein kinase RIO1
VLEKALTGMIGDLFNDCVAVLSDLSEYNALIPSKVEYVGDSGQELTPGDTPYPLFP